MTLYHNISLSSFYAPIPRLKSLVVIACVYGFTIKKIIKKLLMFLIS